ncbi:MAG: HAD-IA family hydrolase [Proteobacteria bacterium]|nr:HAD-IA family hydrolase [Pseudomonadota bacterium]
MLKAIIFDYNGVLVNDLKIHEEAYWRAGKELGMPVARETVRKYLSHSPEQKRKLYYGDISDETWEGIKRRMTRCYFDLAEKRDVIFPDVEAVLTSLSARYILALISNTRRKYFNRIFPRKLASLFSETIFFEEIRKPKPSPDPLLKMMERLGIGRDQCCYVGDSVIDVQMAKRVNVKVFSVATGDNSKEELQAAGADWIVNNLSELNEKLKAVI